MPRIYDLTEGHTNIEITIDGYYRGPTGSAGSIGPTGPAGPAGAKGDSGTSGYSKLYICVDSDDDIKFGTCSISRGKMDGTQYEVLGK